jgi:hypothetical protein
MILYFETLPEELNQIILFKIDIDLYDNLHELIIFKLILDKKHFWSNLLNDTTKNINYNLIPNYLFNYRDNEYITNICNYIILYNAYKDVQSKINYFIEKGKSIIKHVNIIDYKKMEYRYSYAMQAINNFDVLSLRYTKKVDYQLEYNIKKLFMHHMQNGDFYFEKKIIISLRTKGHRFILENLEGELEYPVSQQDIFNALLHAILNGNHQLEY